MAGEDTYLVTGALGCIGAGVVTELVREGTRVVGLDAAADPYRLRYALSEDELARVPLERVDITDVDAVAGVLDAHRVTHVIHLAALQVPACRANPARGAMVNVAGTAAVFQAVRGRPPAAHPVVFASSVAAYETIDELAPGEVVTAPPTGHPTTHYGVYKRANEDAARVFLADDGIPSIGLRPHCVYGVGRDQGLTSAPTQAMVAAALGEGYRIPYGGAAQMQHVGDVARAFLAASRADFRGAAVFNLGGPAASMPEVHAAIAAAAPEAAERITFEDVPLPFPPAVADGELEAVIGPLTHRPLRDGVAETVEAARRLAAAGLLRRA